MHILCTLKNNKKMLKLKLKIKNIKKSPKAKILRRKIKHNLKQLRKKQKKNKQ